MYYHNGQEARKVIQATDNRNNDFKMANQAMGLLETPDGYVWHHLDDYNVEKNTITMELVMDDERVIIRTKLEKPSKIKGLALI